MSYFGIIKGLGSMKKGRGFVWLLVLAMGAAMPVAAQAQQMSVYVNFSATRLTDTSSATHTLYGPTAGLTYTVGAVPKIVSLGVDLRGGYATGTGTNGGSFTNLLFGPKVATHVKRVKPYGEFLIGFARYNDGLNTPTSKTTDSQIMLNAGVDFAVAKHLDWRVVEYSWSKYLALNGEINPTAYSTGVVLHF